MIAFFRKIIFLIVLIIGMLNVCFIFGIEQSSNTSQQSINKTPQAPMPFMLETGDRNSPQSVGNNLAPAPNYFLQNMRITDPLRLGGNCPSAEQIEINKELKRKYEEAVINLEAKQKQALEDCRRSREKAELEPKKKL